MKWFKKDSDEIQKLFENQDYLGVQKMRQIKRKIKNLRLDFLIRLIIITVFSFIIYFGFNGFFYYNPAVFYCVLIPAALIITIRFFFHEQTIK